MSMNGGEDATSYSYASKPRAVQSTRIKNASDRPSNKPNIMHDPRVVRGSVFAAHALLSPRSENNEKPKKRKSHGSVKKNKNIYDHQKVPSYSFTPFSLEANLVEQVTAVAERESYSQTDEFVRYVTPKKKLATADGVFHRPKVGIDSGTQIEPEDKLFDFNVEVKPLLNVLVSKTLAQALAEVKEEMEMNNIKRERTVLLGHKADVERTDRELEDKAKQAFRQKEQKKADQHLKRQRIKVMKEKVLAWQLAHRMVPKVIAQTTVTLENQGVFYNPLHRELAQWLASEVYRGSDAKLHLRGLASSLLDDLLFNALRRQTILAQLLPYEQEALVRITLRDPIIIPGTDENGQATATELSVIGPVSLSRQDSLSLIEQKLQAWIMEKYTETTVDLPVGGLLSLLNSTESN